MLVTLDQHDSIWASWLVPPLALWWPHSSFLVGAERTDKRGRGLDKRERLSTRKREAIHIPPGSKVILNEVFPVCFLHGNMAELMSDFVTSAMARVGGGAGPSSSLMEAIVRQARIFDEPLFDNLVGFWTGVGIFVGGWFAGWLAEYLILNGWAVNWKRVFHWCSGERLSNKDRDDPLFPNPNDPNASANRPKVVPVKTRFEPNGTLPSPVIRVTDAVGVVPQQYKEVPVVQVQRDSKLWSGVKPSRAENYVRLAAIMARVIVLIICIMLAFQAAGVNVLSLAASMGIISLCFTYGGANLIQNYLSAAVMYGTNKYSIGMYVSLSESKQGIITAFRGQWTEITNDLQPSKGRQVHLVPNGVMMNSDSTILPDGPPTDVVLRYFAELESVNKARIAVGLPSLQPVEGAAFGNFAFQ